MICLPTYSIWWRCFWCTVSISLSQFLYPTWRNLFNASLPLVQPLVADRFDLMEFGWESVREFSLQKVGWFPTSAVSKSFWVFGKRSPHINPAISICVHTSFGSFAFIWNLESWKVIQKWKAMAMAQFQQLVESQKMVAKSGKPMGGANWVGRFGVFWKQRIDVSRPSGWPLVGNEGMKLYLVIMGIHSQIPYKGPASYWFFYSELRDELRIILCGYWMMSFWMCR